MKTVNHTEYASAIFTNCLLISPAHLIWLRFWTCKIPSCWRVSSACVRSSTRMPLDCNHKYVFDKICVRISNYVFNKICFRISNEILCLCHQEVLCMFGVWGVVTGRIITGDTTQDLPRAASVLSVAVSVAVEQLPCFRPYSTSSSVPTNVNFNM